jgi:hypothetical protein
LDKRWVGKTHFDFWIKDRPTYVHMYVHISVSEEGALKIGCPETVLGNKSQVETVEYATQCRSLSGLRTPNPKTSSGSI